MTGPQSAEAVPVSDETMAWTDAARARQAAYEADQAAFIAQVKRNADKVVAQINASGILPEGMRFEWK